MIKTSRFIGLLCILTILVSSFAGISASAADTNSNFTIVKGVLTQYNGSGGSVTIPNGVTGIGESAFKGCEELTDVTIPKSVTSIGHNAFRGCIRLAKITIPSSVTNIGNEAFSECSGLTNITIPNSVITIGVGAFGNCTSLTNLTIPNRVDSIGDQAFIGCISLTNIDIPKSVTNIGQGAFESCTALTNITIPNSVTSIGKYAFSSCSELTNVTLSSSMTSIGESVFRDCKKLTDITIPSSVTKIDNFAFNGCTSLSNINVESDNKNYSSIDGVLFDKSKQVLLCYPAGRTQASYIIPQNVTFLEDNAFAGCKELVRVTIPRSVTQIGAFAFSENIAINGYVNTAAQTYAKNIGIPFHALDAVSAVSSTVSVGAAAAGMVNSAGLFFVGFLVCAAIVAACVILWNKKHRAGKKSAQTLPPSSRPFSQAQTSGETELETEAEPQEREVLEVICSQCGHSCMPNNEICPTCGRKLTK